MRNCVLCGIKWCDKGDLCEGKTEYSLSPSPEESPLREKIEKAIGFYLPNGSPQVCNVTIADIDEIIELIKNRELKLLKRIKKELLLFVADHDQPMRDEALEIINEIRKEIK